MRNHREEEYWRQYATDVYLLERQRRWERAAMAQHQEDWGNVARGIRNGLLLTAGILAVIFAAFHFVK